mgnify:CR=1 FL=1
MKAIVAYSDEEYEKMRKIYASLYEKTEGLNKGKLLDNLKIKTGYAHYTFSGDVSDKLIEMLGRMPTGEELIMIVDSGFSHFGASCSLEGKHFTGRVNTD